MAIKVNCMEMKVKFVRMWSKGTLEEMETVYIVRVRDTELKAVLIMHHGRIIVHHAQSDIGLILCNGR